MAQQFLFSVKSGILYEFFMSSFSVRDQVKGRLGLVTKFRTLALGQSTEETSSFLCVPVKTIYSADICYQRRR